MDLTVYDEAYWQAEYLRQQEEKAQPAIEEEDPQELTEEAQKRQLNETLKQWFAYETELEEKLRRKFKILKPFRLIIIAMCWLGLVVLVIGLYKTVSVLTDIYPITTILESMVENAKTSGNRAGFFWLSILSIIILLLILVSPILIAILLILTGIFRIPLTIFDNIFLGKLDAVLKKAQQTIHSMKEQAGWFSNKQHQTNSPIATQTKESYGEQFEKQTAEALDALPNVCYIPNVYLPTDNQMIKSTEVDIVAITPYGIMSIECKGMPGKFVGTDTDGQWAYSKLGQAERSFSNPLLQNNGHIIAIKKQMKPFWEKMGKSEIPLFNVVCTPADTDYDDVKITKNENFLVHIDKFPDFYDALSKTYPLALTDAEMLYLHTVLEEVRLDNDTEKENHIASIHIKTGKF